MGGGRAHVLGGGGGGVVALYRVESCVLLLRASLLQQLQLVRRQTTEGKGHRG